MESTGTFDPGNLKAEIDELQFRVGILEGRTANNWIEVARNQPTPVCLFGDLWFENEVCVLFSDTNTGKSVAGVQIAESLASGVSVQGFPNEADAMVTLLFDFELSEKQFQKRYSEEFTNDYEFSENLIRLTLDMDAEYNDTKEFEVQLMNSIEKAILKYGARAIIVDNITYIKNETDRAKDAAPLMKRLKDLKNRHNLSILVLAHTPKIPESTPISVNHLSGSKALMNFADSAFAIGRSILGPAIRYFKQIKVRSAELRFGADNVLVCELQKVTNFLRFEHTGYSPEKDHLSSDGISETAELWKEAFALKSQNKANTQIAEIMGIHESTVRKYLRKYDEHFG